MSGLLVGCAEKNTQLELPCINTNALLMMPRLSFVVDGPPEYVTLELYLPGVL